MSRNARAESRTKDEAEEFWSSILPPPCSDFSRARDRSNRTRVRSQAQPGGIRPLSRATLRANLVARRAADFAVWVDEALLGKASLENPDTSYLWSYARKNFGPTKRWKDTRMSYCRFGKRYKKNTRFRSWNLNLSSLAKKCTRKGGKNTCGQVEHAKLEGKGKQPLLRSIRRSSVMPTPGAWSS